MEPIGANLVVVKTRIGAASSVAVVLDYELGKIVAGTIAGDDTVFVAIRSRSDQGRAVAQLNAWIRAKRRSRSGVRETHRRHGKRCVSRPDRLTNTEGAERMTKTAVLAFSGGLDTTYCAVWLREAGYAVHSVAVQTGGFDADELAAIERRARAAGVAQHVTIDARIELFDDYLRYLMFANALRGGVYPLCVSAERVAQAKRVAQYAVSIAADAAGARLDRRGQRPGPLRRGVSRLGARHGDPGADPPAADFPRRRNRLAGRAGHRRAGKNQQVFGQSRPLGRHDRRPGDAQQRRRAAGGGLPVDPARLAAARRAAARADRFRAWRAGPAGRRAAYAGGADRAVGRRGGRMASAAACTSATRSWASRDGWPSRRPRR